MKTRKQIIADAIRIKTEILQIFTDVDHWNDSIRLPGEPTIDPDPNGQMKKVIGAIDLLLKSEREQWTEEVLFQIIIRNEIKGPVQPDLLEEFKRYAEELTAKFYDQEPHKYHPHYAVGTMAIRVNP